MGVGVDWLKDGEEIKESTSMCDPGTNNEVGTDLEKGQRGPERRWGRERKWNVMA